MSESASSFRLPMLSEMLIAIEESMLNELPPISYGCEGALREWEVRLLQAGIPRSFIKVELVENIPRDIVVVKAGSKVIIVDLRIKALREAGAGGEG